MELKNYIVFTFILALILLSDLSFGLPGQIFNISDIACHENPEWFEDVKCNLRLNNKGFSIMDISANVKKPIENIMIHIKSFAKKSNNEYRDGLYDFKMDGCAFLSGKGMNALSNVIFNYAKQAVHFTLKCPISGYAELKNFTLRSELVPVVSHPGDFKFTIKGYADDPKIDYGYLDLFVTTRAAGARRGK